MPKISYKDADNYNTGGGGGSFLQLKENKETVQVRFMLEEMEDLNNCLYVVHSCKTDEAKWGVDVNCLREYNDPVDMCPLCKAGIKKQIKAYIPVWNETEGKAQLWSRGKKIIDKLQTLMDRYEDFPSHIFTIQRNGKKGSTDTTYEIFEDDQDDTTLEDLGETPTIEGFAVKNYSEDDMEYYLESGEFPPEDDDDEDDVPVRRNKSKSSKSKRHRDEEEEVKPRRRHRDEPEDDDEDDDEEEERPVRKKSSKSKKRRHRDEDDF